MRPENGHGSAAVVVISATANGMNGRPAVFYHLPLRDAHETMGKNFELVKLLVL